LAPTIQRIALGVVNTFIPSEPTERRLPQQADESMAATLAGAGVTSISPAI
jgi:hypothetical protein